MKPTEAALVAANPISPIFRVGLIGAGIQASRMPRLHEQEARAQGLALSYRLIDIEHSGKGQDALPDLLTQAQRNGFAGVNITHPFKQSVIALLDELSPDAAAIGAVNTVVFQSGRRIGYNTDCYGFAESFRRGLPDVLRRRVVLLGAGGAGSAVAVAALQSGVERLLIYDVDADRASSLADRLHLSFDAQRAACITDLAAALPGVDGLIQTTPIGMLKYPGLPLPIEWLRPSQWLAEIIYFPLETELLRQARALGCQTLDGSGMAVYQAAEAFRLFTGSSPNVARMLRYFDAMNHNVRN
jgi:shikimate dehydrogenase